MPPRRTARTSSGGSTTSTTTSTGDWPTCTWPTRGSRSPTRTSMTGSPNTCTTPSTPTPTGTSRPDPHPWASAHGVERGHLVGGEVELGGGQRAVELLDRADPDDRAPAG